MAREKPCLCPKPTTRNPPCPNQTCFLRNEPKMFHGLHGHRHSTRARAAAVLHGCWLGNPTKPKSSPNIHYSKTPVSPSTPLLRTSCRRFRTTPAQSDSIRLLLSHPKECGSKKTDWQGLQDGVCSTLQDSASCLPFSCISCISWFRFYETNPNRRFLAVFSGQEGGGGRR